jgi:hypothetical protein
MKRVLLTALLFSALFAGNAFAGFIINVEQAGANLKFTYNGSFVMTAAGITDTDPIGFSYTSNYLKATVTGGGENPSRGKSSLFSGAFSLVSGNPDTFFTGSGNASSFAPGSENFIVVRSTGEVFVGDLNSTNGAGTYFASGSFTVAGQTLASIGYTANESRKWNWTQTGQAFVNTNTLTINAVPEPSSIAVVGGLVAGLSVLSRRRRQA